tara:strand:- start:10876 stop:11931 length:1056 start_codon:yes stop_codon:yes gene_type:complete
MEDEFSKRVVSMIILAVLIVVAFILLRPILMSIIIGIILVVVFAPVYEKLLKIVKFENLSAAIISISLIVLIVLPFWFLTPVFIEQSFQVYIVSQQIDFVTPLKNFFPSLFASEEFSIEVGSILHSFVTKATNSIVNSFSKLILNFPIIFLQLLVVFATFFFVLRDKEKIISYIKSLTPFSREVENKLLHSSREITISVIYGQIVVGIVQGLIVGAGFFIFNVSNPLFLTFLAILAGMFPVIGTTIVWAPVVIYLFIAGDILPAIGIAAFGLVSSGIDNILKPILVSRRTRMHPLLTLMGMIGGLLLFGIFGFILGPLILAYVLILLEVYRNKPIKGVFLEYSQQEKKISN